METDQSGATSLAYLVHDLDDAAVRRRLDLFAKEGYVVGVGGFRRRTDVAGPCCHTVLDLGRTEDARLGRRAAAVARWLLSPAALRRLCSGAPVIVARNLEMLLLASRVRAPRQRIVYECLDIHRIMLGSGRKSRFMRWLERRLLKRANLVIVSSPAFARDYFAARQGRRDDILLVENKVPIERRHEAPHGVPGGGDRVWTIGWFGMLRCRKTLGQLAALAAMSNGRIEVIIAGMASAAEFPDFAGQVVACPGLRYLGPFRQEDLPGLYAGIDFVWAIDYFEEGLNSDWLLPNRLYEGLASGVVPIALRGVETGRWLDGHGVGLLVDDAMEQLPGQLAALRPADYACLQGAIRALPEAALYQTPGERRAIAAAVMGRRVA